MYADKSIQGRLKRFITENLKLEGEFAHRVEIPNNFGKALPMRCLKNVDDFCARITQAEPLLCWAIQTRGKYTQAVLHAVIRYHDSLRDITPGTSQEKDCRIIVLEPRMTVQQAVFLCEKHGKTFLNIMDFKVQQDVGIDFFRCIASGI